MKAKVFLLIKLSDSTLIGFHRLSSECTLHALDLGKEFCCKFMARRKEEIGVTWLDE